jgi:hypothetical protein
LFQILGELKSEVINIEDGILNYKVQWNYDIANNIYFLRGELIFEINFSKSGKRNNNNWDWKLENERKSNSLQIHF